MPFDLLYWNSDSTRMPAANHSFYLRNCYLNNTLTKGEMKLAAGEVKVSYGADKKSIETLVASGGVTVTNLGDAAEAKEALYTIGSGVIVLSGDVLLTQGPSAMAGQKLTINLKDGTGVMEGRVTTTFVPGGN